ncbi:viperin family antiviral radical SAM protein [Helicobacter sp. NHP22-001]|uniref:viperin family antiviral radical SAM protein n=1 Tax=Helicobacter sp. NHP22-001 TaxID=3040202 RepID=UPI00244D8D7D|nr:viperin family antiviral radical SAM protein [Helicobacter sp. NHP22-001]GMB96624.1 viperin family antiviral radical SAM protein [Helicobacter sp. NHP22-001]
MDTFTLNWHITEACNFQCQYCFAKWQKREQKELLHTPAKVRLLLDEVAQLPVLLNFKTLRLNLVGGEIFLYPRDLLNIIQEAKARKMHLSAITNASLLDQHLNNLIATHFETIGFSVDSLNTATNTAIGRCTKKQAMDVAKMKAHIASIRTHNPKIQVKINTVVNLHNQGEYLGDFIQDVKPSKWKIFKMLPILDKRLAISDGEFQAFLDRHQQFASIISSENNDEMTQSYLMVDPFERFFQNGQEQGYFYSEPIIKVGVCKALKQIPFSLEKFSRRYLMHAGL